MKKIVLSDVLKKHLKVIGYLAVSSALAYAISVLADKPEAIYFTPIINYILFSIEKELANEGVIRALKK